MAIYYLSNGAINLKTINKTDNKLSTVNDTLNVTSHMRIKKLDGLRGIFSLMIVIYHYPQAYLPDWLSNSFIIRESYTFVDFFFVLSGFVIAYNYQAINTKKAFGDFLKKRFIRLYPLLFYTAVLFLIYILVSRMLLIDVFPNYFESLAFSYSEHIEPFFDEIFFMNSTPILGTLPGLNIPSWSISSEMISYLLFATLTLFCSKKVKEITFVLIILISAVFLYLKGDFFAIGDYGFLRGFVSFYLGYFVWRFHKTRFNVNPNIEYLIPIALIIVFYTLNKLGANSLFGLIFGMLIIPLLFSSSILLFIKSNGYISKILETKPVQYLGKISFSVYLNHMIILTAILKPIYRVLEIELSEINQILIFALILALVIVYSNFTYKYVELKGKLFLNKQLLK